MFSISRKAAHRLDATDGCRYQSDCRSSYLRGEIDASTVVAYSPSAGIRIGMG